MPHEPGHQQTVSELVNSGGGVAAEISQIVSNVISQTRGGAKDDPLLGGVPEGFTTEPAVVPGAIGPQERSSPARFRTSDIAGIAQWPIEKRQRLILEMMKSGLVSGDTNPRWWTTQITEVLTQALSFANVNGIANPFQAVSLFGQTVAQNKKEAEPFEPSPYLQPDYATLAQRVKQTVRSQLGRDPNDYELRELTAELTGFDRMSHEREQELARMVHEQGATPGVQQPGTVQAVDPLSRFNELFEKRYAGEIDVVEDRETFQQNAPRADAIIESGLR